MTFCLSCLWSVDSLTDVLLEYAYALSYLYVAHFLVKYNRWCVRKCLSVILMHFVYLYWVFVRLNPNRNVSIVYCVFCLPIDLVFYVLPLFRFEWPTNMTMTVNCFTGKVGKHARWSGAHNYGLLHANVHLELMHTCLYCSFHCASSVALRPQMVMSWSLMSSDVIWHIRDKLWSLPKHGSINLYVHGNQKAR